MNLISSYKTEFELLRKFIEEEEERKETEKVAKKLADIFTKGKKVLICGNGGSNCDAMHFIEEFTGRFRKERRALPAISISDPSHITCVANDYGFEYIEDKYGINFSKKINVLGNLEVIKGLVREGIGNVILPYYSVYKDIRKGTFKVIAKIDEIKDGYELIITKDKKDLSQITKFIDLVKSHKIVMEGSRN